MNAIIAELNKINSKLDNLIQITSFHSEKFISNDKRFNSFDKRFEKIDERFGKIDKRFEKMDERFEKMDKRFEKIDKTLALHTSILVKLEKKVSAFVDMHETHKDYFRCLTTRIKTLETAHDIQPDTNLLVLGQ